MKLSVVPQLPPGLRDRRREGLIEGVLYCSCNVIFFPAVGLTGSLRLLMQGYTLPFPRLQKRAFDSPGF